MFDARDEATWDNLLMDKDRDLLPWILSGLSVATIAVAITVASTNRTAPATYPATTQPTAYVFAPAPPESARAPAPTTLAPTLTAASVQVLNPPLPPATQIWECTNNGQKIFADYPCGGNSSLRVVGPINSMEAEPLLPPSRSYEPQSSYQSVYSYPGTPDAADNSYPIVVVHSFIERRRPDHAHRLHTLERGPAARRN